MVIPFLRRRIDSNHSAQISWTPPLPSDETLEGKLQRLARQRPDALTVIEHVVDRWLANDEGEAS